MPLFYHTCSTTKLLIKRVFGDLFPKNVESWRVGLSLFGSVVVGINIKCLIFAMAVTDPPSLLPTNFPASGFLRPHETQIYTILCYLRYPTTLNLRTLSPRTKIAHYYLCKSVISPGGLRKPQTSLRNSRYIPDRIGVETNHKHDLIAS